MDDFLKDLVSEGRKALWDAKQSPKEKAKLTPPPQAPIPDFRPVAVSFLILRQHCTSCGGEHQAFQGLFVKEQSRSGFSTRITKRAWEDSFISLPISREEVQEEIQACGHCLPVNILIAQALFPSPQLELPL